MLSDLINLNTIQATKIIDYLYQIFHRDFVANNTFLANIIYVNPKSHEVDAGKERVFWHLTTRDNKEWRYVNGRNTQVSIGRLTDYRRAERLEWVKQIIENHNHSEIKMFYHKESTGSKEIRLYLWAFNEDFVVILQKLGRSETYLVTSFYIDYEGKRKDFEKRYNNYISKIDPNLLNCEWF